MANEPKNSAEEQLKRYASQRRQQPAPELHPATRRLLQGEVARIYGSARSERPWWRKMLVAPVFVTAMGLVAVLGFSFLALRQSPQNIQESNEQKPAPEDRAQPINQPTLKDSAKTKETLSTPASAAAATVSPAPTAPPPIAPPVAPPIVATAPGGASTRDMVKREATPKMPAANESSREARGYSAAKSVASSVADEAIEYSFSNQAQLPPAEMKKSGGAQRRAVGGRLEAAENAPNGKVLTEFKMQQVGQQVRIVDADKSVYVGPVVALRAGTNTFRAAGTNQTLQKPVVFTGQYYRMPLQTSLAEPAAQQETSKLQVPLAQQQMRVQGQALVGGSNQIQVDAQSPTPSR